MRYNLPYVKRTFGLGKSSFAKRRSKTPQQKKQATDISGQFPTFPDNFRTISDNFRHFRVGIKPGVGFSLHKKTISDISGIVGRIFSPTKKKSATCRRHRFLPTKKKDPRKNPPVSQTAIDRYQVLLKYYE